MMNFQNFEKLEWKLHVHGNFWSLELDKQIADYTSRYEPDDQLEWLLVLE